MAILSTTPPDNTANSLKKIERIFRRFDYGPKRSRLTIRMPSPSHDYFATYFRDEICKELNKIASSRSDEAKPFAGNVISALGSRVFLAETDDENDPIKRELDIQFHYPGARYPGIVVEVYSQDGKDLRRLAQDYILYSNGDIKLVIGIDLSYRGKPSTVSLWRPKFTESEDGLDLETFEHVHEMPFRSSDGDVLNPDQSLTIDIREFATDELSETWPTATINIPFSRLAQNAQDAQQRQKEQEPLRPDDSVKSRRRPIRKRRWSSSSVEELRSEDEAKYSNKEDSVAWKYHVSDTDYEMKFTLEPPNKATIFTNDARNTSRDFYEIDENGEKRCTAEYDVCNGKGIAPLGTEIHLEGIMDVWKTTGKD
ncbi:hypothetical protein FOXB_07477 [Fusarium oxysporum f. sp. conglutinans Fo5176]|uniref:Uncharacterized protein n=1 Tax=Fusarium oxysporum (strain Fo5176) TaxID=660025 RepID=F9FM47_FUSOF|nr:hypothetical protein FOXB_07477 [Fusarium oxysporum f. sp. conglutinans Fo5176]KAI8415880.1 hypothetical protein FOFC_05507 [Fusarium oxysporum]